MTEIKTTPSGIKKSNLVYLLENNSDLKKINFLKLDKKVLNKIESVVKEAKSKKLDFFLGEKDFENLHILFFSKKDKKNLRVFLGKQKLPKNLSLIANTKLNTEILVETYLLSSYKFQKYKSEKKENKTYMITSKNDKKDLEKKLKTIENVFLARDLAETPSNDLTPEVFTKIIQKTKFKNTKVKILTPKDIQKKGLNLLWAVGKGSVNKPYMVILERIVDKKAPTYGFIGKGIVFDTGGIQVKPEGHMYEMKGDMCGASTAFATMKELDDKNLNVNIIVCLCLAENHISGESFKPSDIFTSYSGKTVDIGHTDAEGRLVLADGISYISKKYKTNNIITIATLTGACIHALGYRYAGIMGDDEKTISSLLKNSTPEMYWRLPFDDYFVEKTKSEVADLENINRGVKAGSTMGGAFLYNFLMNKEKFTHIDIAGPAMNSNEAWGIMNKGMTGFGVMSLSKFFEELR